MTGFGPLNLTEQQITTPSLPFRLVGLEPGPERKVRVIEIESFEHALFVVQDGQEKGCFVPTWIESADGLIVYLAETIYSDLRKRREVWQG
jgi:hypothetical protein